MGAPGRMPGRALPSAAQEHLLRAALGKGEAAIAEFRAWQRLIDLEAHLDNGSFRLLPLLYETMRRAGLDDPMMGRLKGVYRHAWYETQQRLADAAAPIALLEGRGIPTMVSKGLPLTLCYYAKPAFRPMADIDIVVPMAQAKDASSILVEHGWVADRRDWREHLLLYHSLHHGHPATGDLDLHWHLMHQCCTPAADHHFWSDARPLAFNGVSTLRPSATDMLFHVVIHGMLPNPEPPVRWVADAVTILRSGDEVDFQRLVEFAEAQKLTHLVSIALRLLVDKFAVVIPASALERLERGNVAAFEKVEADWMLHNSNSELPLPLNVRVAMYRRLGYSHGWRGLYETWIKGVRRRGGALAGRFHRH